MIIKDLGGHSGCKILLLEENGLYFVRKISASRDYNERLEAQRKKQSFFSSEYIKTPKIIKDGYNADGLYFFDMEYIKGITLAKYISKIDVCEINGIVSLLVDSMIMQNLSRVSQNDIFIKKISDLKTKTASLNNQIVNMAIDYLTEFDWSDFSNTPCHGDLTFENIIVQNGELYFIDFLDSFYDSWLIDIGKLLQDAECFWSYRNEDQIETNIKLRFIIFKKLILNKLISINPNYILDSYVSLLLVLLRIYPYVKDDRTFSFLDKQVSNILHKIEVYEICEH